ncbi:hypothetical protein ASD64_19975 [Mesorhizobium sp. Root157]|uniref:hypothetical protein n=1 Tax=Mesorhizobium sp. Root157 TaxID=1736477 RepID=UPI0006F92E3A|nr:hypothetical protein [Mesorhizobium sp. Root157]KQZ87356.1 hypothetical protein ASD64_19975 [Mesorhizobium sp. Root157]
MTNDATRATATALPEINRRRFLITTATAGAAVAVAAPVVAAEPEMTALEKAEWHIRELRRLVSEDGGKRATVMAVADYGDGIGHNGCRAIGITGDGRLKNDDGMFARKAVRS